MYSNLEPEKGSEGIRSIFFAKPQEQGFTKMFSSSSTEKLAVKYYTVL